MREWIFGGGLLTFLTALTVWLRSRSSTGTPFRLLRILSAANRLNIAEDTLSDTKEALTDARAQLADYRNDNRDLRAENQELRDENKALRH